MSWICSTALYLLSRNSSRLYFARYQPRLQTHQQLPVRQRGVSGNNSFFELNSTVNDHLGPLAYVRYRYLGTPTHALPAYRHISPAPRPPPGGRVEHVWFEKCAHDLWQIRDLSSDKSGICQVTNPEFVHVYIFQSRYVPSAAGGRGWSYCR